MKKYTKFELTGYVVLNIILVICLMTLPLAFFMLTDNNLKITSIASIVSIMSLVFTVLIFLESTRNSRLSKEATRKVMFINKIKENELEKYISEKLTNELQGKSIDKIEIVNTSIGQNDNRKDIIIIYH